MNFVEAVPSAAAWARAVPAIVGLRSGFLAPGGRILPGASTSADFDIAQLQDAQRVRENAFSGRVDVKLNSNWTTYVRVFRDQAATTRPTGCQDAPFTPPPKPTNGVFSLQGLLGSGMTNEFKFGYNAAQSTENGVAPAGFENIILNLSGSVANTGIAGQGATSGLAIPGPGLVRVNRIASVIQLRLLALVVDHRRQAVYVGKRKVEQLELDREARLLRASTETLTPAVIRAGRQFRDQVNLDPDGPELTAVLRYERKAVFAMRSQVPARLPADSITGHDMLAFAIDPSRSGRLEDVHVADRKKLDRSANVIGRIRRDGDAYVIVVPLRWACARQREACERVNALAGSFDDQLKGDHFVPCAEQLDPPPVPD